MNSVTGSISAGFIAAMARYPNHLKVWSDLAHRLAGRIGILPMAMAIQRAGALDLVLRAMEDEFHSRPPDQIFDFHHHVIFAETWICACYEPLRAARQREREAANLAHKKGFQPATDAISSSSEFKSLFGQLELLRIPIAKFEIAKDHELPGPLTMVTVDDQAPAKQFVYDKDDPNRFHIAHAGVSPAGSICWLAVDHKQSQHYWIERRQLSDLFLSLAQIIEPAGLRESRLRANLTSGER